jgi:polysaccharide chain length determinant protein (PEP-CTERM system associated)
MHEIFALVMEEIRGAWRYRWQAVVAAWAICLLGWLVVLFMPNKFEATARVFVDPTTALKPVIQGLAVEQDVNAELNLVRQSLLSEPQLAKIVAQTSLGDSAATTAERAQAVRGLRDRTTLEIRATTNPRTEQASPSKVYELSYLDANRERSLEVVGILLNNFVEGTLGGKRDGALRAQNFLVTQIKDYELRLATAENSLAEFKKRNVGMVPGEEQGDFFSRLQAEMDEVKASQTALGAAVNRREALQLQLRGESPVAASSGSFGPGGNGFAGGGGDTMSRLKDAQARLDDLLLRFTDKHPDVVAARENIEQMKARRESEIAALRRGDANAAAMTGASSNPIYQNILLSLNQAEVEIATQRNALGTHQSKVAELRKFLDTMPQVEAEYARLTRDYNVTKAQYTSIAERLEKAHVGGEADASGSVRFEIIDPPFAAFEPVSPARTLLLLAVPFVAFALGAGLAYLLNLLNPVFATVRSLKGATGLQVLGAIALMRDDGAVEKRRDVFRLSSAVAGLLILFAVVMLVGKRFAPLGDWL